MQRFEGINLLEIFAVVVVLGVLSLIAAPQIGKMIDTGRAVSSESELGHIQTAVVLMLKDSGTGELEEVGPTADMKQVRTTDIPPLVLTDYLTGLEGGLLGSGRTYRFAADGTVLPGVP